MTHRVLLAGADGAEVAALREALASARLEVAAARDAEAALTALRSSHHDVLVVDVALPGTPADLVASVALDSPDTGVIALAGGTDLDDLIGLLRQGPVFDYLRRPFVPTELTDSVVRCVEMQRLRRENRQLRERQGGGDAVTSLVGGSPAMTLIRASIARVAPTDTTVLLTGSSGTGKEVAAHAIHELSRRARGPFVAINCGALPSGLLESELFGHARGAFTGAERSRVGCFEQATGGTLFLDEVGTMDPHVQVRFLRALGSSEISRIGEDRPRTVDARVVAATNADLRGLVAAGRFRADLYYRLAVGPIHMPDLRDRPEDVPALASHLLEACCRRLGRPAKGLSGDALAALRAHPWPGNVRELENALQRGAIMAGDAPTVRAEDLLLAPAESGERVLTLTSDGIDLAAFLDGVERSLLFAALERTGQNRQRAAGLLGIGRTTLVQKLRRLEARGDA